MGNENNVGIVTRTIKEFYKQKQQIKDEIRDQFVFYISFYQIYNEQVYDLLNFDTGSVPSANNRRNIQYQKELKVRYNNKDQFIVENLFLYECKSAKEAITLYS